MGLGLMAFVGRARLFIVWLLRSPAASHAPAPPRPLKRACAHSSLCAVSCRRARVEAARSPAASHAPAPPRPLKRACAHSSLCAVCCRRARVEAARGAAADRGAEALLRRERARGARGVRVRLGHQPGGRLTARRASDGARATARARSGGTLVPRKRGEAVAGHARASTQAPDQGSFCVGARSARMWRGRLSQQGLGSAGPALHQQQWTWRAAYCGRGPGWLRRSSRFAHTAPMALLEAPCCCELLFRGAAAEVTLWTWLAWVRFAALRSSWQLARVGWHWQSSGRGGDWQVYLRRCIYSRGPQAGSWSWMHGPDAVCYVPA